MSLTNDIETKILKKLTGLEKTGSPQTGTAWTKPSGISGSTAAGKLHLKLFTSSPGEASGVSNFSTGVVDTNLYVMEFDQIQIGAQSAVFTPQFPSPPPANKDERQYFIFFPDATTDEETASEVTSIGLCDSNGAVIWYENLTGSAVRKYRSIDELKLTSVIFGLSGSAICRDLASYVLKHIFSTGDSMPELNATYLAFYNGDPGFNGDAAAEQGTRYPMGALNNDSSNTWEIENGTAYNADMVETTFTEAATVTHVALRSAATGGEIYWRGPLLSPQKLAPSDKLAISPGQLALSID